MWSARIAADEASDVHRRDDVTRLLPGGEAIQVWGPEERPAGFVWRGVPHRITSIGNRWQVRTRWWEASKAVWRVYYRVTTDRGVVCELYWDELARGWFLARVYD
jgi:hypothetical protein